MKTIIVGVDGSPPSLLAVQRAGELAEQLHAQVIAVGVFDAFPADAMADPNIAMPVDWIDDSYRDLKAQLDGPWTQALQQAEIPFSTQAKEGHASDIISDLASETGAAYIFVGNRGHGTLKDIILGSVSHSLILKAPCPVVVITPHMVKEVTQEQPQ